MQIYSSKAFVLFLLPTFPVSQVDLTVLLQLIDGEYILLSPHVFNKDGIQPCAAHLGISALEFHEFTASG